MRDKMKQRITKWLAFAVAAALLGFSAGVAFGSEAPIITVDGVEYEATKVSGPTIHFETPDINPQAAFTARHVWSGKHGAEHLPCEGGIHWIDNKNLLTISHCLESPTTTTVVPTTTTVPSTTTTTAETTTTDSAPTTTGTLPYTGAGETMGLALTGLGLVALGAALVRGRREA